MAVDTSTADIETRVVVPPSNQPIGEETVNPNVRFKPKAARGESSQAIDPSLQAARGVAEKVREQELQTQLGNIGKGPALTQRAEASLRSGIHGSRAGQKLAAAERAAIEQARGIASYRQQAEPPPSTVSAEDIQAMVRAQEAARQAQIAKERGEIEAELKRLAEAEKARLASAQVPQQTPSAETAEPKKPKGVLARFKTGLGLGKPSVSQQPEDTAARLSGVTAPLEEAHTERLVGQAPARVAERKRTAAIADIQSRIARAQAYSTATSRSVPSPITPIEAEDLTRIARTGQTLTRERSAAARKAEPIPPRQWSAEAFYKRRPDIATREAEDLERHSKAKAELDQRLKDEQAAREEALRRANIAATHGLRVGVVRGSGQAGAPLTQKDIAESRIK